MGKIIRDTASDTSDEQRRKTVRDERKLRAKRKKRKRELTDLHQRLFKSRKRNRQATCKNWKSNFVKLLHRFADIRQEYDKETKIDGKLGKARNSKRTSNRILPKPANCAGIYRNGAVGKEIHRSQVQSPQNNLHNARLEGNVIKLLHGYDSKSEGVTVNNDAREASREPLLDSTIKNILEPTPPARLQSLSPVLGKVDGKRKSQKNEPLFIEPGQKLAEQKKIIQSENLFNSALSKYEELCTLVSAENFEGQHFPEQFTTDPLTAVKRKLRSIYAESFRSQFLRDMIKRGTVLNECETPSTSGENKFPAEITYSLPGGCTDEADLVSVTVHNPECHPPYQRNKEKNSRGSQDQFFVQETNFNFGAKRNENPSTSLLFDAPVLNKPNAELKHCREQKIANSIKQAVNEDYSTNTTNHASTEANHFMNSMLNNNNVKFVETPERKAREESKTTLFLPMDPGPHKNVVKRKNQRTQTVHVLGNNLRRHIVKQNLKMPAQMKMKNLKHIPAILRRCNNPVANNRRLNLFQEPVHVSNESREVLFDQASELFSSGSLIAEFSETSRRPAASTSGNTMIEASSEQDLNVQTCVMASPSLRHDNVCFLKTMDTRKQNQNQNQSQAHRIKDIFVQKNPVTQKTVMFTKKDSRNPGHCGCLNNRIADEPVLDSNVSLNCIIKKNLPVQQEKPGKSAYVSHRSCCRTFACPQVGSREFRQASQVQQPERRKALPCEKVFLKRVTSQHEGKKCHKDQHVCYVVVDRCNESETVQECPSSNTVPQTDKSRVLQAGHVCPEDLADVGILKGVQNLKILPVEERESQMKFASLGNRCIDNALILEEQPIKYLACEDNSKARKIPIYLRKSQHVSSVDNVEILNNVIDPGVNYRVVPCPQESGQKIILVPTCEQNKVLYVKQQDLGHSHVSFDECTNHPRKMVLYRPDTQCVQNGSNVCGIHVPHQNVMEIKKNECEVVANDLQQPDGIKKLRRSAVNWEELHYRPRHDHSLLNDACVGSQTIYYEK